VLLSLLVEDGNGVGRPVAFAVMTRDRQTHIEQFLNFFSEYNDMQMTQVVVTDKAVTEMNAVQKCWPNTRPLICHFHMTSTLDRYVKSCDFAAEDRKECSKVKCWFNYFVSATAGEVFVLGHLC